MTAPLLLSMMNSAGRLRYADLQRCAMDTPLSVFTTLFMYPSLVGTSLCPGAIHTRMGKESTMLFKPVDEKDTDPRKGSDKSGLQKAIFAFVKQPGSKPPPNRFTIGRTDENDLIMPDYAISRIHAQIDLELHAFYLTDLESRNGTRINGAPLTPHQPAVFTLGDELAFGRFRFALVEPETLFIQLRNPLS